MNPSLPPLTVPHRFHGPPSSGNGGWTAGALAERLTAEDPGTAITVALRLPPPLETPLAVSSTDAGIAALVDGRTVAEARLAATDPAPLAPVSAAEAADAETRFPGYDSHPFPTCFSCGPLREPGDGLRIFPGRLSGTTDADPADASAAQVAATWTPYDVSVPITWAALDCSGGWASGIEERPMVLGTITLQLHGLPTPGAPHVVVGALRGEEGRKSFTSSTLYDPDGAVVATAEHVWIAVNPKDFG